MRPQANDGKSINGITAHKDGAAGYGRNLVSAVNGSRSKRSKTVTENIAVALDELGATAARRHAALLQVQGKN